MQDLIEPYIKFKKEKEHLDLQIKNQSAKLKRHEKELAQEMQKSKIKSLQSFNDQVTLNQNMDNVRVYHWKSTQLEPSSQDVSHFPNLQLYVDKFRKSRNDKQQILDHREELAKRIEKQSKRIIQSLPKEHQAVTYQLSEHRKTLVVDRSTNVIRLFKWK
jgi:hypothetical protein